MVTGDDDGFGDDGKSSSNINADRT